MPLPGPYIMNAEQKKNNKNLKTREREGKKLHVKGNL